MTATDLKHFALKIAKEMLREADRTLGTPYVSAFLAGLESGGGTPGYDPGIVITRG